MVGITHVRENSLKRTLKERILLQTTAAVIATRGERNCNLRPIALHTPSYNMGKCLDMITQTQRDHNGHSYTIIDLSSETETILDPVALYFAPHT